MKYEYKLFLIGSIAILIVDTLGSILSRQLDFMYSALTPVSLMIYGTASFLISRKKNLKKGVIAAVLLGLFDGTIGWKISILLNANIDELDYEMTTGLIIMVVISAMALAALMGLVGGGVGNFLNKKPGRVVN